MSSLLWYWLFSSDFGFVNRILLDLGIIERPVLWLGVDADRSNYAIIASIVWKVIGFGMILFVGAIQAIPTEITEATMVDGASYWQRVRRVILPLTRRTVLLVTLISVIGSLLAFDQFYIMTAGQPHNETATSVFYVYLNSFPYLKLGYGAALSLILAAIVLAFTVVQMAPHPPERGVSAGSVLAAREAHGPRGLLSRLWDGRTKYLVGAICLALCTIMLTPLVLVDPARRSSRPPRPRPVRRPTSRARSPSTATSASGPTRPGCRPTSATASGRRS